MSLLEQILEVEESKIRIESEGGLQVINTGEAVKFTQLLNQPMALILFNNNSNNPVVTINYDNQKPRRKTLSAVDRTEASVGFAYVFDPSVSGNREISVSLNPNQSAASISAFIVSQGMPHLSRLRKPRFQVVHLQDDGERVSLNGYSRAFSTPPFAWFDLNIEAESKGLIGFLFEDRNVTDEPVTCLGINMPDRVRLESFVEIDRSLGKIVFDKTSNTNYEYTFFGQNAQFIFCPVHHLTEQSSCSISLAPSS